MEGWVTKPLADVCTLKPPKKQVKEALEQDAEVSFVPMDQLGICQKSIELNGTKPLSQVYSSYTYFAENDVLLAKITPCFENGKLGVASGLSNGVGFGSSEFHVLRCHEGLLPEFLFYFLSQPVIRSRGAKLMTGAVGHKRVPPEFVQSLQIPVPPLPEQKRIVAILDETFEGIDKAIANTEKNLVNARELFDATVQEIFGGAQPNWRTETLQYLLDNNWIESHLDGNHGSDYPRKEEFVTSGVPYISANCIDGEQVDLDRAKYLSPERALRIRKGVACDGDVLFAHNATVGPVAMLSTTKPKVILGTSLTYYRCNRDHIIPEYLAHYMRSPLFRRQYELVMGQSTRNQVPITKQREFTHVLPPLNVQREIATRLNGLDDERRRLEVAYGAKVQRLVELKQVLLGRAFAGQLSATHELTEAAE